MKKQTNDAAKLPAQAFDRVPRVTLTLTDETIWLTRHDPRGRPAATYPVSSADVGRAFAGFTSTTGLLPDPGKIDVLFVGTRNGRARVGAWLPPARREIRYASGGTRHGRKATKLTIPLPGLMFVGEGTTYWVWATLKRPRDAKDRLYSAPLPNIHPDGSICQGSAKFPVCAVSTIGAAVELFFESEFNDDLSHQRVRRQGSLLEFLRSIEGVRRFPEKELIEAGVVQMAVDGSDVDNVWMPTGHQEAQADYDGGHDGDYTDDPAVFMGDGEEGRLEQEGDFA